jgi:hypothetical protein
VSDKKAEKHVITFAASVMLPRFGNQLAHIAISDGSFCFMQNIRLRHSEVDQ